MSGRCVLCVDDEQIVLTSLKDQLRSRFGRALSIETAESGEEALEVLEELLEDGFEVPTVISDQLMPGMKGEELLAEVRALDDRILTILLTGQATAEAVGAAVNRAGLYRFLAKPWAEEDLILTVSGAITAWEQARELEQKKAALAAAHEASMRFVPAEFLALLGRERVVDVRFGDHIDREITVFFSKLHNYTALVRGRGPAEALELVGGYLERVDRSVRAHGGFISAWKSEAILALFPSAPDDAIAAGRAALQALAGWRAGPEPLRAGVGINTGRLVLGTVGDARRLQCDLVGDAVNLAARIEGLTRYYGSPLLISEHTCARLQRPQEHALRELDRVQVKGKRAAVTISEVLSALPAAHAARRQQAASAFRAARQLLAGGDPARAAASFERLLADDADDGAARALLDRCRELAARGLPEGWSGVAALDFK